MLKTQSKHNLISENIKLNKNCMSIWREIQMWLKTVPKNLAFKKILPLKVLLENGADANAMDKRGKTPLFIAIELGYSKFVEFLLRYGADVNARYNNHFQYTPLHYAAVNGKSEIAELLIKNGADINGRDKFQNTPVHIAAKRFRAEVVELLLQNGADVNPTNSHDETPLMLAARYGHPETVEILLKNGARKDLKSDNGKLPLEEAKEKMSILTDKLRKKQFDQVIALLEKK